MARKFVVSVDLLQNELINARVQNVGTAPSTPVEGQIYYNNTAGNKTMYFYNGTDWIPTSGSTEVIQDVIGSSVLGGTALTATYNDGAGTTTLDLDNTAVTAGSYGSQTKIATFTVDAQGRLTAAGEQDLATQLDLGADNAHGGYKLDLLTDSIKFVGGEGIDTTYTTDNTLHTITIAGEDATSANKGIASFDATDFTVSSGNVTLNVERVEDVVGNLILGGTGIDATYTDGSGTLSIDIDSTVTTNSGTQTLTNKTLGSGTVLDSDLNANSKKITNLAAPVNGSDAANKDYVDAVSEGLHIHPSAVAATTGNIDLSTALENGDVLDGVTLVTGNRVLVKDQSNAAQNGIYVVQASGAAVRATDFDQPQEVDGGDFIFVTGGTINDNTGWVQTSTGITAIGTDPIYFTQFAGAGTYTAGAGLTLTGTVFSADVTPNAGNASLINTGGAIEVKTDTSRGLSVDANGLGVNAGTGLTFTSGALTFAASYGVRKYSANLGNAADTSFTVNHALATRDVTVQVYENASPYAQVEADVEHTDSNNLTVRFASAPTTDQYRVVVVG